MRRSPLVVAMILVACGGAEPSGENPEVAPRESMNDTDQLEAPLPPGGLAVRVELERSHIPAMTSPSASIEARVEVNVFVRAAPGTEIDAAVQMAHELTWTFTADDGTAWEPTFLPPPMPMPGGPPHHVVTLDDSGEARLGRISSISGFHRPDEEGFQPGLPAGEYRVAVGGFVLGDGPPLDAPPVTLTVR
ncbi:MAG: hypothetical protein AB8I08_12315 [Sandaracinaceae bacterium]